MKIHHDKHYQAYFDKYTKAITKTEFKNKDVEEILKDLSKVPEKIRTAVINHGGGYFHHRFLWPLLKKEVPFEGEVAEAIKAKWGSFEQFKEEFSKAALSVFGSGWTWLVVNEKGELEIISTKDQDSPVSIGKKLILTIDVWEHQYYLKYQNRRAEFIENYFNIIHWGKVNELFLAAK